MASPFTPPTIPGAQGYPLGLTGATAATRYVGATASGAPASGAFVIGDYIIDQTGKVYVCTVAGSPGTWVQTGGSGAIPESILDAKGDLIAASAADTAARLAVGANGATLVADSTQTTGLKYANGPWALGNVGYRSAHYHPALIQLTTSAAIPAEAAALAIPFLCRAAFTADRIAVFQSVAGGAGALVRLGIYSDNGAAYPGALLLDAGTYDASTGTGVVKEITISQALTPGLYWLVAAVQGVATPRPTLLLTGSAQAIPWFLTAATVQVNGGGFSQASVSGALGTPFTTSLTLTTTACMMWLRAV